MISVWDPLVRIFHWSLVVMVVVAWISHEGPAKLHDGTGYAALVLIAVRFLWGWIGTPYARFRQFVRSPSATLRYMRSLAGQHEPRYLGHNPLGGWMVIALLASVAGTGLSGWLFTTDAFWGVKWVEDAHEFFADMLVLLIALHIAGIIFTSRRHGENLAKAMINGKKPAPADDDVA